MNLRIYANTSVIKICWRPWMLYNLYEVAVKGVGIIFYEKILSFCCNCHFYFSTVFHRRKLTRKMCTKSIPSSCLEAILELAYIVSIHSVLWIYIQSFTSITLQFTSQSKCVFQLHMEKKMQVKIHVHVPVYASRTKTKTGSFAWSILYLS